MLKLIILFISTFVMSQNLDENHIRKLSFTELDKLYFQQDSLLKEKIANIYLKKAIDVKDNRKIITGYLYKFSATNNNDLKIAYLDKIRNISKLNNDFYYQGYSYYLKAHCYMAKRKYSLALDNFLTVNKYIKKGDDENIYYSTLFSIALIKSSLFKYKEALPLFLEYAGYSKKIDDKTNLGIAYFAISESYNRIGDLKRAELYTNYGKELSLKLNDKQRFNKFLICEGLNFYKKKKYLKAITLLKPLLNEIKYDFANYSTTCFYIGKSYNFIGKDKLAMIYFKKVDSIFVKEKAIYFENIKSYNYLIDFYKKNKNFKEQLYYTNQLVTADSILFSDYDYLSNKIHKDYELPKTVESKQQLIDKLINDKFYTIGIASLIISFLVGFIYHYRKKQKTELLKQKEALLIYKQKLTQTEIEKSNTASKLANPIDNASVILDEQLNKIILGLELFEKDKRFLDKECTLDKLAKEIETNTTYLSKIINEKKACNFPNYVNGLRIEYGLEFIQKDNNFLKYNIKGLADLLGFNNANSFSRAFELKTKMKPSFFINELKTTSNL